MLLCHIEWGDLLFLFGGMRHLVKNTFYTQSIINFSLNRSVNLHCALALSFQWQEVHLACKDICYNNPGIATWPNPPLRNS